ELGRDRARGAWRRRRVLVHRRDAPSPGSPGDRGGAPARLGPTPLPRDRTHRSTLLAEGAGVNREGIDRHNEAQQTYFERRVPGTMIPRATPYVRRHIDELLAASGLGVGSSILEVGCGMGNYTFELASRG